MCQEVINSNSFVGFHSKRTHLQKQNSLSVRLDITTKNLALLFAPLKELYHGARTNSLPWDICSGVAVALSLLLIFKVDHFLISHTRFNGLYPYHPVLYRLYAFGIVTVPFWVWAWGQVRKSREKLKLLTAAFKNAGLESKI